MTEAEILTNVVSAMKDAQQLFSNGGDKKDFVLRKMKEYLGDVSYARYQPLISLTIDFIKKVSMNKEILNGIRTNRCCALFC